LPDTLRSTHFHGRPIEVIFDTPPALEKTPGCPDGFIWEHAIHRVTEMLSTWSDFTRRGRAARNMRPEHAAVAAGRGSLGVGRFYFRARRGRAPDLYYDRVPRRTPITAGVVLYRS
jgi:hypothetical protein